MTNLIKCRDGVYRQATAYAGGTARLLVAANDNMTAPLCRQSYDVERALAEWRKQKEAV